MYTDPAVVRRKVERELAGYWERHEHYRARGIWLLWYDFPQLLVVFAAPKSKPYPVAPYGVLVELSNYDVEPPSIRFVNPFTLTALKAGEIPTKLSRLRVQGGGQPAVPLQQAQAGQPPAPVQGPGVMHDQLLQTWSPEDDRPFVCLQGVREYHDNPAHTGDPWWLYRGKGAGSILRLLELLSKYGTEAFRDMNFQIRIEPVGFQVESMIEAG